VSMIVAKAVNMAKIMKIPVVGIVENMSYFKCPDCGKEHHIFGESHVDAAAAEYGIKNVAKLPIDPAIATMVDAGEIESADAAPLAPIADFIEKGEA
jgi:Mrp family chromosome partitioning ATPase